MTLDTLQTLIGWCLAINLGIYLIWMAVMCWMRDWLVQKHARWFGLDPESVPPILYRFLGLFKLLIILLNFTPWVALVIMNRS